MSEATPRQVLYALVAGGFVAVVFALVIGAAASGLVPLWWTLSMSASIVAAGVYMAFRWRRTVAVLSLSIVLFVIWTVGTLLLA